MNITLAQAIKFNDFFDKIQTQTTSFQTSYNLSLLHQHTEKQNEFYLDQFRAIISQYGQKDEQGNLIFTEDGSNIQIIPEFAKRCYEELYELENVVVEVPDVSFQISDFQYMEISPMDIQAIMPFIQK